LHPGWNDDKGALHGPSQWVTIRLGVST
jgi:hypothetical protein